jgi:hypothetical protein
MDNLTTLKNINTNNTDNRKSSSCMTEIRTKNSDIILQYQQNIQRIIRASYTLHYTLWIHNTKSWQSQAQRNFGVTECRCNGNNRNIIQNDMPTDEILNKNLWNDKESHEITQQLAAKASHLKVLVTLTYTYIFI